MRRFAFAALALLFAAPAARADISFGSLMSAPAGGPIAEISMQIFTQPPPMPQQYRFRFRSAEISFIDLMVGDIDFGGASAIDAGCTPVNTPGCDMVISNWSNWVISGLTDITNVPVTVTLADGSSMTDYVNFQVHDQVLVVPAADTADVPEPASLALLGAGLAGLAVARRRVSPAGAAA